MKIINHNQTRKYLDLREMFEYKGDVPNDHNEIFKYNKIILESNKEFLI